jgi:hypothetical protein
MENPRVIEQKQVFGLPITQEYGLTFLILKRWFFSTRAQSCNNALFESTQTRKRPTIVVKYNNESAQTRKRPSIVVKYNNESAHTRKRPAIVVKYNNESLS